MAKGNPTDAEVIKALKKLGSADDLPKEQEIADELGIKKSEVASYVWPLEAEAFPSLALKATGKAIADARATVRWEKIAWRADISVTEAKKLYADYTGEDPADSALRGGNRSGNGEAATSTGTSGRRRGRAAAEETTGTSGRRRGRAAASTEEETTSRRGRRRQRSSNPS